MCDTYGYKPLSTKVIILCKPDSTQRTIKLNGVQVHDSRHSSTRQPNATKWFNHCLLLFMKEEEDSLNQGYTWKDTGLMLTNHSSLISGQCKYWHLKCLLDTVPAKFKREVAWLNSCIPQPNTTTQENNVKFGSLHCKKCLPQSLQKEKIRVTMNSKTERGSGANELRILIAMPKWNAEFNFVELRAVWHCLLHES